MEDMQKMTGMCEYGFYVNTDVTKFIGAILSAPGNLIGIGELKEPITIDHNLCLRISRLLEITADISYSPINDKCFYVNIGLLSFINRVLNVGFGTEIQIDNARTEKDYLLDVSKHPLICSVITKH